MRLLLAGLLVLLLAAPAAQACSLAYMPFQQATFHDDGLWYIDGSELHHVEGAVDTVVSEGFFLSYARLPDDVLLVAGQDGLGADCSGERWMELREGAEVRWRRDDEARVFPHPLGPFVHMQDKIHRLEGDDLVLDADVADEAWILGFTADGVAVVRENGGVSFGERHLPTTDAGGEPAVAGHGEELGVLEVIWGGESAKTAVLHVVQGDQVRNVTWALQDGWGAELVWASGGWLAAAGGRAYLVTDRVTDLGVAEVRTVSAKGDRAVVFTDDGYVVFDGTEPVEAWERTGPGGLWRPVAPDTQDPRTEESQATGPGPWVGDADSVPDRDARDHDVFTVPVAWPALLALALLAAAARARR